MDLYLIPLCSFNPIIVWKKIYEEMVLQWSYKLASSTCIRRIILPSFKKKPQNHLIQLGILMAYLLVQRAVFGKDTLLFIRHWNMHS